MSPIVLDLFGFWTATDGNSTTPSSINQNRDMDNGEALPAGYNSVELNESEI